MYRQTTTLVYPEGGCQGLELTCLWFGRGVPWWWEGSVERGCLCCVRFISLKISKTIGILARLTHLVPTGTFLNDLSLACYAIFILQDCVWGHAAKYYITFLQKRALWLITLFCSKWCSCCSSFHSIKDLTCKYDLIWHGYKSHAWYLERSSPFAYKSSFHLVKWNSQVQHITHAAKGNYVRKEVKLEIFKCSFSRSGPMLRNQISPNWRDLSKPIFKKTIRWFLFETLLDRDDCVEVDTLTQFLDL